MSSFSNVERDIADLALLVNENQLVTTRYDGIKESWLYFTGRLESEFNSLLDEVNKSRGFRVVGDFSSGFNYELPNDIGIDSKGDCWVYTNTVDLPVTIPKETLPSSPNFKKVTFSSLEALTGLSNVSDLNLTLPRNVKKSTAINDDAQIGTLYIISDLDYALYVVVDGTDIGGFYITGLASGRKLKKIITINETVLQYGTLPDLASTTLALQSAINFGKDIVIDREITITTVNLISDTTIRFAKGGLVNTAPGNKAFQAIGAKNITLHNPKIKGVYAGVPSIAEHAIDLTRCSDVEIYSPVLTNIGGNGVRLDLCNDIDIYDLKTNSTGFLGYIAIDCNRDRLHSAYIKDAADPFSVQSKGGTDSLIDNVTVENPDSCGVIVNTNNATQTPAIRPRVGKVTILGDAGQPPFSGTRGGVFMQSQDGFIGEVYMSNNNYIPQLSIGATTDNLHIGKVTVESNTSIGIDVATDVGTVIIQSLIAKGNQDRAARFRSGRIHILGGDIRDNGIAGTANIEFIDWDYFVVSGVTFQRVTAGSTRPNILLAASSGQGLISGNSFTRNNQPDVKTVTGEFRIDCPNVSVHGNENCFLQVTTGWLERFEIKDGLVVESGYSRATAPKTGTWISGDTIRAKPSKAGDATKFVCISEPNTFLGAGIVLNVL